MARNVWRHGSLHERFLWFLSFVVVFQITVQQIFRSTSLYLADSWHDLDFWMPPSTIHIEKNSTQQATNEIATMEASELSQRQPDYHVVFSTSCTDQQHWESYVFYYHCMRVRQRGTITRIVSGCNEIETANLLAFHNEYILSMADRSIQSFEVHFTPDYSRVRLSEGKFAYKYMNKPYGLRHWMENSLKLSWTGDVEELVASPFSMNHSIAQHEELLSGIVILMDPDMVLLKPIGHDFSNDHEIWAQKPAITKVQHGNPFAQQDGYLHNEWMSLNFTYITGDPSIKAPPSSEGPVHWNTGPPYLATVFDMYKIVSTWTETAPRVLDVCPELFAEMYGFIIATVMLKLPFHMIKSIVVSTTGANSREGWPFIDSIPDSDICRVPVAATSTTDLSSVQLPTLPTGLHYCGIYLLGTVRRRFYDLVNCDYS
jgi:peptidyl serine alpha-galactosyltransferase